VLLTGESGTGKEILSHYIHALSPRQSHKFLAINCSALPENLLETELFGHVKGSFTGATHNKIGLLKEAHHGTFFFDEISELPMAMQTKLLRFLQDHEIRPTGSVQSERVDVRILAATNRDLLNEVKAGRFREDLFYRFNVISIHIPPLRERKEDIPQLIEQFIETHNQAFGKNIQGIQPQALKALVNLPWPGNIRELKNVLERALIFSNSSEISLESLAFLHEIQSHGNDSPNKGVPYSQAREQVLSNFTSQYLDEILRKHKGNVTKAAQAAKLGRQSFHRLLKIHQIDSQTYRQDDLLKN
jgi:two-component system response regulator GlrR